MNQVQYEMKSSLGSLFLVASSRGLEGVYFDKQNIKILSKLDSSTSEGKILLNAVEQLQQYLRGERKIFDVPLYFSGTDFQEQVWRALIKIPFGKVVSYADIAKNIKNSKAVRAVGNANGRNPICIIIPCHRVIASDGTLGGYSSGLQNKKKLLALEGIK